PFNTEFNRKREFRASLKSDSGVYVRGPQLQVRDFIRRNEMKHLKKFKNDDWNELAITVKNGKPVADLNGKSVDISKIEVSVGAVAKCLCNGEFMENMKIPLTSKQ